MRLGNAASMRYRKVISERIGKSVDGVAVAGSINAVVAVNVNETGRSSHTSSKQRVKVIQRDGRTEVYETTIETEGDDASPDKARQADAARSQLFTTKFRGKEDDMTGKKSLRDAVADTIKAAVAKDGNNVASAINVGGSGKHTSVKSSKRVVQRDGVTRVTEEREERSGE